MSKLNDNAMPRWVKVFGIVAILVVAVFIALHVAGLAPHEHEGAPHEHDGAPHGHDRAPHGHG